VHSLLPAHFVSWADSSCDYLARFPACHRLNPKMRSAELLVADSVCSVGIRVALSWSLVPLAALLAVVLVLVESKAVRQALQALKVAAAAPVGWSQAVFRLLAVFPRSVDSEGSLLSVGPAVFRYLVVDRSPEVVRLADDTAVCFLAVVAASQPEVASVVSAAGNTVDDSRVEIPDSSRPTNTDSRSIGHCRSKPFLLSSSYATRNSPSRNSNC